MRMIVFFDLPMNTRSELGEYRQFRKFLIKNGFIMMQESVYSRLVLNGSSFDLLADAVNKNLPTKGVVQMLKITEKQYASILYLRGNQKSNVIDNEDRIIVL